jgi:hypothetical protein
MRHATLILLIACAGFARTAGAVENGFAQRMTWIEERSGLAAAEGLYLFVTGDRLQTSRMLIITPTGRRLVVSHRISADGKWSHTLLDESTRSSVTVAGDSGDKKATLQELFRSHDTERLSPDKTVAMSIQIGGGKRFEARELPYGDAPSELDDRFLRYLDGSGATAQLRDAFPSGIRSELPFLAAALTDDARGELLHLVVALSQRILADESTAYGKLKVIRGEVVHGRELIDAEQRSFAAAFESVALTNPLLDRPLQ